MESIIVSQHPATIKWLQEIAPAGTPVISGNATPEDVRGRRVFGNLPLRLAAEAAEVVAVEFEGDPPRGREYSFEDMLAAGVYLQAYTVRRLGG